MLSDEPIPVTISEQDQLVELDVVNEIITGSVEGLKTDNEGTPIEGVVFGLFAPDTTEFTEENALALSKSTAEGLFRFEDIRYGKYLIKELSCGEEFVMCEDVFEVDISENGQVVKITVINKRISGKVQVVKLNSNCLLYTSLYARWEPAGFVPGNTSTPADEPGGPSENLSLIHI